MNSYRAVEIPQYYSIPVRESLRPILALLREGLQLQKNRIKSHQRASVEGAIMYYHLCDPWFDFVQTGEDAHDKAGNQVQMLYQTMCGVTVTSSKNIVESVEHIGIQNGLCGQIIQYIIGRGASISAAEVTKICVALVNHPRVKLVLSDASWQQVDLHPIHGVVSAISLLVHLCLNHHIELYWDDLEKFALRILAIGDKNRSAYHFGKCFFTRIIRNDQSQFSSPWSHGDIYLGLLLQKIFKKTENHEGTNWSECLLRSASNRPLNYYPATNLGLNGGTSGHMWLMLETYNRCGDPFYKAMAEFWLERTLAKLGWRPNNESWLEKLDVNGKYLIQHPDSLVSFSEVLLIFSELVYHPQKQWYRLFGYSGTPNTHGEMSS